MTTKQVADMVALVGVPTAYYAFPETNDNTVRDCPFICFFFTQSDDVYADDENYQDIRNLIIELYTDNKDYALENTLRSVLISNNLTFTMASDFISSEKMFITTFTTEVIISNGE